LGEASALPWGDPLGSWRGKQKGWTRFCGWLCVDHEAITKPFLEHIDFAEDLLESSHEVAVGLEEDVGASNAQAAKIADAEFAALQEAWQRTMT